MKKNSENAKFGWKKIRIKWNLDLCNRNICVLLEHQSKGKMSIYLAATQNFDILLSKKINIEEDTRKKLLGKRSEKKQWI